MSIIVAENEWQGLWDLGDFDELRGMVEGLMRLGHKLAVFRIDSDWQCGWKNKHSHLGEVWGMPLQTATEALHDATSRFFKSLKLQSVYSHIAAYKNPKAKLMKFGERGTIWLTLPPST